MNKKDVTLLYIITPLNRGKYEIKTITIIWKLHSINYSETKKSSPDR